MLHACFWSRTVDRNHNNNTTTATSTYQEPVRVTYVTAYHLSPIHYLYIVFQSIPEIMTDEESSHDYGVCPTPLPQPALRSVLRERVLEKPLPVPFTLPSNYPPIVAVGLQAKQLSGKAMVKFITVIANAVFNFKSYPTKDEKEHVARQCVKAFPFLEANCGSGHVGSNAHSLLLRLPMYFIK